MPIIVPISFEPERLPVLAQPIKLYVGGVCLEVQVGFCGKTLREVLDVLKSIEL